MSDDTQSSATPVRRRKIFYLPGYDPFHPRRYRELYRKESAAQAAISNYEIALQSAKSGGPYGWQVDATIDGQEVHADFEVLVWSDIVKDTMTRNIPRTYLMLARTAWIYIGSGAFGRLLKTRKGPMIAALYPIFMLTLQLIVALLLGWVGARLTDYTGRALVSWLTGADLLFLPWWGARFTACLLVFLGVIWLTLRFFRRIDNKLFAYYLMHD